MTVEVLLETTSRQSPLLRAQRATVAEAEGVSRQAWSSWWPQLTLAGEGRWNAVEAELDLRDLVVGLAPALGVDPTATLDALPPATEIQPRWAATAFGS